MRFNVEASRRLGIYLDKCLQFQLHKNIFHERIKHAKDRVRKLGSIYGLVLGLNKRIQVSAVQAVAVYGVEI